METTNDDGISVGKEFIEREISDGLETGTVDFRIRNAYCPFPSQSDFT